MSRFIIGLLLGLLIGIGGTAAFLITAGGGDYLVVSSPRVRELETTLKTADTDRDWLRKRLSEANDSLARLETRFVALSARFESLVAGSEASGRAASPAPAAAGDPAAAPTPRPSASPGAFAPGATPTTAVEAAPS